MAPRARQAKSKARLKAYEQLLSQSGEQRSELGQIYIPPGPRLGDVVVGLRRHRRALLLAPVVCLALAFWGAPRITWVDDLIELQSVSEELLAESSRVRSRLTGIDSARFLIAEGKYQGPVPILRHGLHELIGNQEREIELAQAAVFSFGTYEIDDVRMTNIEGAHLRTAPTAR